MATNRITRRIWRRWNLNIVPWAIHHNTNNARLTVTLLSSLLTGQLLRLKKAISNKLMLLRLMPHHRGLIQLLKQRLLSWQKLLKQKLQLTTTLLPQLPRPIRSRLIRLRLIILDRLLLTDLLNMLKLRLLRLLRPLKLLRLICNWWLLIQLLLIQGQLRLLNTNSRLRRPSLKAIQLQLTPNNTPLIQLLLILAQLLQLILSRSMQLLVTAHRKRLKDTRPVLSQGQLL